MGGLEGGCSEELGAGRNTLKQEGRGRAVPPALRSHSIQLCLLPAAMPGGHSSPSAVPSEAHGRGNEAARVKKAVGLGTQQGLSEHQENPRVTASEAGPWTSCEGPAWQNLASESLPSSPETPDPSAQMQSQAGQHLFGPGLLTHHERGPDPEQLTAVPFGERLVPPGTCLSCAPSQPHEFHKSRVLSVPQGPHLQNRDSMPASRGHCRNECVRVICVCVQTCLHVCGHAYTRVNMPACVNTSTRMCPNMPTCMCEHAYTCVNMPACVNTSTHVCVRTCLQVCVRTCLCVWACLHVCEHTCMCEHVYTHMSKHAYMYV